MYKCFFKRFFDFWISLIALIVISPILLIVTFWLHFANKGAGAFFFQERPGYKGKLFKVIKYKTMTDERDAEGNLLPDADRLTKVGKFVRSTSIDELPQLINVLKGDMALIGPRPLLPKYLLQLHLLPQFFLLPRLLSLPLFLQHHTSGRGWEVLPVVAPETSATVRTRGQLNSPMVILPRRS